MLSTDQNITIPYNGKKYPFVIADVRSDNNTPVSVIDTLNKIIVMDLFNPFIDELVNDKKQQMLQEDDAQCNCQLNMSKITGGLKYNGITPMSELRKLTNY